MGGNGGEKEVKGKVEGEGREGWLGGWMSFRYIFHILKI